jgi:hypothetical protein
LGKGIGLAVNLAGIHAQAVAMMVTQSKLQAKRPRRQFLRGTGQAENFNRGILPWSDCYHLRMPSPR